jgi:hypothetical protein
LKLLPGHVGGLGFKLAKVGRQLRVCESRVSSDYSSEPAIATHKSRGGAGAWAAVAELAAEAELAATSKALEIVLKAPEAPTGLARGLLSKIAAEEDVGGERGRRGEDRTSRVGRGHGRERRELE